MFEIDPQTFTPKFEGQFSKNTNANFSLFQRFKIVNAFSHLRTWEYSRGYFIFYSTLNKITRFWLVERSTIIALIVLRRSTELSRYGNNVMYLKNIQIKF